MSDMLIGVLVYPIFRRDKYFGEQNSFLLSMSQAADSQNASFFMFEPCNIDWPNRRIHGYRFSGHAVVREWFRFPDVIYDRFFPNFYRKLPNYSATVKQLQRTGIPFVNAYLGGKLRVYQELSEDSELRKLLPETRSCSSTAQVMAMLDRYHRVFLKPVNGTQGAGIIRVDKAGDVYTYVGRVGYGKIGPRRVTRASLVDFVGRLISRRAYLVQQPIYLKMKNGSVMDVRVVIQKADSPVWQVTGMAWRVGAQGAVTSNLHTGGHAEPVASPLREQIVEAAVKIATGLDQKLGPFGELGLDFGVDTDDRIWFIEANGRLGRMIFTHIGDMKGRQLAITRPILYARWLKEHKVRGRDHDERPSGYTA